MTTRSSLITWNVILSLLPVNKYVILSGSPPPVVHITDCAVSKHTIKMNTLHIRYSCHHASLHTTQCGMEGCGGTAHTAPHVLKPGNRQRLTGLLPGPATYPKKGPNIGWAGLKGLSGCCVNDRKLFTA